MKTLVNTSLMACLLATSFAYAGMDAASASYANSNGDYDLATGVYVQAVSAPTNSKSDNALSYSKSGDYNANLNLLIYNPKDNSSHYLLDNNYGEISNYVIETAFQEDDAKTKVGQYIYLAGAGQVQNNVNVAQRSINNNIVFETYQAKTKTYTVWKANKLAAGSKVLFSYQAPARWHIDAKNQVIRLVTPLVENKQARLKISNFAW